MKDMLGKLKVWQTRLATYVSMVNFIMIFYLYIIESPLGLKWFHWLLIICVVVFFVMLVDVLVILPSSQNYLFDKNPGLVRLEGKVDSVVITGGFARPLITDWISAMVDWIAPVQILSGEREMIALAEAAVRYLTGREMLKQYI